MAEHWLYCAISVDKKGEPAHENLNVQGHLAFQSIFKGDISTRCPQYHE